MSSCLSRIHLMAYNMGKQVKYNNSVKKQKNEKAFHAKNLKTPNRVNPKMKM